jgi:hypothetical protein
MYEFKLRPQRGIGPRRANVYKVRAIKFLFSPGH